MQIDGWLLDILACPECHAPLRVDEEASELVCTSSTCGLAYPVRDDIPVLLVEEARRPIPVTCCARWPRRPPRYAPRCGRARKPTCRPLPRTAGRAPSWWRAWAARAWRGGLSKPRAGLSTPVQGLALR